MDEIVVITGASSRIGVCVLAAYAGWALDLEDAAGRSLLPFGRRSTTSRLGGEPGVRGKL
jgi:hypothetical protein